METFTVKGINYKITKIETMEELGKRYPGAAKDIASRGWTHSIKATRLKGKKTHWFYYCSEYNEYAILGSF